MDTSFMRQSDREEAFETGWKAGTAVWFVERYASEDEARRRFAIRASDDLAVSDGRLELEAQQKSGWEPTSTIPQSSRLVLDTSGKLENVIVCLLEKLDIRFLECRADAPS